MNRAAAQAAARPERRRSPRHLRGRPALRALLAIAALGLAMSGQHATTELDAALDRGRLAMLTINGATTYYLGASGEAGFEHDLAQRFADSLGVGLEVISVDSIDALIPALMQGRGDFIAANFSRTPERQRMLRFGPAYDSVRPVVVYRRGSSRPRELTDLIGGRLALVSGTSYDSILRDVPGLEWESMDGASIEDLFEAISAEEIDYTIIDSNILDLNRRYFPAIRPAFEIDQPQTLAWATRLADDDSLSQKMREFFAREDAAIALSELREHYFSHVESYEPVGTFTFMQQMRERLPRFRPLFEQVADSSGLDWRLLAAISYQESHWNPDAVSRTGVRGLMMLTLPTANQLGVTDREDPEQSVSGGARYLQSLIDRLPERIEHPDRLWLALAAYNIGLGHLEDARMLTERQGGNPDRWVDVRERLPLLTQARYFSQTRFGYARGYEAATYVENIRTFYEILVWMDGRDHPLLAQGNSPAIRTDPADGD
ncbi:MAG: membrane-bound lytic murein transglycosylase MltF [Gammaproteobacteria bacterium HGW-Gammaproteobacteria-8]|nr:MAG: membrane-bound lytic murein transglycosylase MltF [Gammaproteobacteria bacterium HGW-Gammaproteobacteria-8]